MTDTPEIADQPATTIPAPGSMSGALVPRTDSNRPTVRFLPGRALSRAPARSSHDCAGCRPPRTRSSAPDFRREVQGGGFARPLPKRRSLSAARLLHSLVRTGRLARLRSGQPRTCGPADQEHRNQHRRGSPRPARPTTRRAAPGRDASPVRLVHVGTSSTRDYAACSPLRIPKNMTAIPGL